MIRRRREQILKYLPELQKKAARVAREKEIPSVDLKAAREIVVNHIKSHQRKIYGGLAIHFALLRRNQPGLYDTIEENDIDFYSPDPVLDMKEITNALLNIGYQNVSVVEAVHFGTVKIKIKTSEVADITYCWRYFYNKIPFFKTKDGLVYVAPAFQIIDTYNTFIDPLFGWYKIDKNIIRAAQLEQFYLFNPRADVKRHFPVFTPSKSIINSLKTALESRSDLILIDIFAYNIFVEISKVSSWKDRLIPIDSFAAYALNPMKTLKEIISVLNLKRFEIHAYRPFLDKYGESLKLLIDGHPYLTLYHADSCLPFKQCFKFQIGTYHVLLRMLYIRRFGSVNHKNSNSDFKKYSYMIQHLQVAREHWLRVKNKLGIEDHIFQELQAECMGEGFTSPLTLNTERIIAKKRFRYIPTVKTSDKGFKQYVYPNTSGRLYKIIDENGTTHHVSQKQAETLSETEENKDPGTANDTPPDLLSAIKSKSKKKLTRPALDSI